MITPRRTRLYRVPDLACFRTTLTDWILALKVEEARETFVLVPTRAAGEQLRRTVEDRAFNTGHTAIVWPIVATRADLYTELAGRLAEPPPILSAFEREVILSAVSRRLIDAGTEPPFHIRPGLIAEMLALYDQIRRLGRSVDDFERNFRNELEREKDSDRGAARLFQQTVFLAAAFRDYETRIFDQQRSDEHALRRRLLDAPSARPLRRVLVTVADRLADPDGAWPADFDLLTRLPGLDQLDLLSTEAVLAAGYLERLYAAFPDLQDERSPLPPSSAPALVIGTPAKPGEPETTVFTYRDREEELAAFARRLKHEHREGAAVPLSRTAVIVRRPLPYLYLARDVFADAAIPFESLDTLPLAAEPYAAAVDLALAAVAADYTRSSLLALLRSPHFSIGASRLAPDGGGPEEQVVLRPGLTHDAIAACDFALAAARYLGGIDRLSALVATWREITVPGSREERRQQTALPAAQAVLEAVLPLRSLATAAPLTEHITTLTDWLRRFDRAAADDNQTRSRRLRVRAAVLGALTSLKDAFARHDPAARGDLVALTAAIRRWLGSQTFALPTGRQGLHIVDAQSARYGDFDDIQIVGLIEGEWPERVRRNVLYPSSLLALLEPLPAIADPSRRERDALQSARAAFKDLALSASRRVRLSTFALENDAVVEPSILLDDVPSFALSTVRAPHDNSRVSYSDALALSPPVPHVLPAGPAAWAAARLAADDRDPGCFRGTAGAWRMPRVSISRLEQYLNCPFKFYAAQVLELEEQPEDEDIQTPLERGRFLHELWERFFAAWQARRGGRIEPDHLPEARALFGEICEAALAQLSPAEAALERNRLLGSAVNPGIAHRVFAIEAGRPIGISERLLEFPLQGEFSFRTRAGDTRIVPLSAKTDRIDLLEDRSIRVIDYKSKNTPDLKLALQLPIYAFLARETLRQQRGQDWTLAEAVYVSFEGDKAIVPLKPGKGRTLDDVMDDAQERLVGVLDRIAAGQFPPSPAKKSLCGPCSYRAVCRLEIVEAVDAAVAVEAVEAETPVSSQQRLDFDAGDPLELRDAATRVLAIDPTRNIALEASAGTGKTRVLVDRYVGLLLAGVKPRNILAITFTRKAAAEMRQRILTNLAKRHREQMIPPELWKEIRDSVTDIAISTIDAFCLALLREFPLEADVDPGFDLADETETPRLVDEALERTLRAGRGIATSQPEMALLFAELGEYRLRHGLARLIDRRLVAVEALNRFLRHAHDATIDDAVTRLHGRLRDGFASVPGGVAALLASGPNHHDFALFTRDLTQLLGEPAPSPAMTQMLLERVREHLLTQDGAPRKRLQPAYKKADFRAASAYERHLGMVQALGPYLVQALHDYRRDINFVLARAVRQLFAIALREYAKTLDKNGVLDFSDVLQRTLALLGQMEEFSRSRFKLEARYQHVLVDEFQDTSRAQWELVELLVRSWAAGLGLTEGNLEPSIFIVGDRKQSIYGFRDAEVAVLDEASRFIEALRPIGRVRTAITRSFRSVRELLHFVNDVFAAIDKNPERADAFRYSEDDTFPLSSVEAGSRDALGVIAAASDGQQAETVADEIARLLAGAATVRDRDTGVRRAARPGDIAILFRTREGHRLFEDALGRRRVPYYVYKGLGFFDADEIKDVVALLSFLARPQSELNAAAFLRSRFVRISDDALKRLAPALSAAVIGDVEPAVMVELHPIDARRLRLARASMPGWLSLVDHLPPSELLDRVLAESAYAAEIAGPAHRQARENLKKVRGLVRRLQNRGYATLGRVVDHFAQLVAGGDESNAIIDAIDAVNLMTAHAAKGLEFPIVFVVNINRGSGGSPDPIRVVPAPFGRDEAIEPSVAIGEHESEADRDLDAREGEEGKRLLYVALTRARDRLYLGASMNDEGQFAPGKGGLGKTLPAGVAVLLTTAAAGAHPPAHSPRGGDPAAETTLDWVGPSGTHRLRVVQLADELTTLVDESSDANGRVDDFAPLPAGGVERRAATASEGPGIGRVHAATPASSIEAGVLVHRALEAGIADDLGRLLRDHERALIDDVPALLARASAALAALRHHPDIGDLFGPSPSIVWRRHEVPFSLRHGDGSIVRGTIDCVVKRTSGTIEVLEFKTGRRAPEHQSQLALYVVAARAMFPDADVEGRLVYSEECEPTFRSHGRLT